jgi:hypothetical protein
MAVNGPEQTKPNRILERMLERLYGSLASGPVLSCRPHSSRQRIDLVQLGKLEDKHVLAELLGEAREVKLSPPPLGSNADEKAHEAYDDRQAILGKLRSIAEDARTYHQDTGAEVLYVGYPLLDLPPEQQAGRARKSEAFGKRILAPICFIPIELAIRTARPQSVTLSCAAEADERVIPNAALIAWIEQTTGKKLGVELEGGDEDVRTWEEIEHVTSVVCEALGLAKPAALTAATPIVATPRSDEERAARVVPAAVLGLFPVSNQGLLRDLEAFVEGPIPDGPIQSFLRADRSLGEAVAVKRDVRTERLVSHADPCQGRAVRLAATTRGLVIHGPPGTGKSQTIANVIGDHLARGERVLFVCDKRTALDVVEYRLRHLELGGLCAVVHDVSRDSRDLYKSVREQLEALAEMKVDGAIAGELERVDNELVRVHAELTKYDAALASSDSGAPSFHAVAGEWLALDVPTSVDALPACKEIRGVALADLLPLESDVREVLQRAQTEGLPTNPWVDATDLPLTTYLGKQVSDWRTFVSAARTAANAVDEARDVDGLPFDPDHDLGTQATGRSALADALATVSPVIAPTTIAAWAGVDPAKLKKALASVEAVEPQLAALEAARPDPELALVVKSRQAPLGEIVEWLGALAAYLQIAKKWYALFCFGRKKAARLVATRFGLALGVEPADRLSTFLAAQRARRVVEDVYAEVIGPVAQTTATELDDAALAADVRAHHALWTALVALHASAAWTSVRPRVLASLRAPDQQAALVASLQRAQQRVPAIASFETAIAGELFAPSWRAAIAQAARRSELVAPQLAALDDRFASVEGILRMKKALAALPASVAEPLRALARAGLSPDVGWIAIRRGILGAELARRIEADPTLQDIDNDRMRTLHGRYRELDMRKRDLVRRAILARWTAKQRERLLASTGSRLNAAGAELKRRLTLRGEKAMRLRQVLAAGGAVEGGDPLFDLRPVWMASPETVAQIFPREALFDVVIFDEASQCRLEEALPVLVRARRVVIAGDPKQLPPTRFFESSIASSDDGDVDASEQGMFEEQQADVEDLLGAALNLEIEQCYLDVHYRSTNADLIEFSNRNFYDARLQAIPGHPKHRAVTAPLRLVRVAGVYDKRANPIEAAAVVEIVKELLARTEPPSIGIACFNLVQRDMIIEALDDAAALDPVFASRLAAARTRKGAASFEGLFVKNLENVQGDERDHIIISTTYGPDPKGKFYHRFGPLARAGGGRRMNVLVTRARSEVHLVSSIPPSEYTALPPVEAGRTPNGAWLLFSYLKYAEELAQAYAEEAADREAAKPPGTVRHFPTRAPSSLVAALASRIAEGGLTSDVYWGNDGFCVDLAVHHPVRADDVTIGVLCDGTRFDKADDPVEWDLFRTSVLEAQGWNLLRVWSPHLVRDRTSIVAAITTEAARELEKEKSSPHKTSLSGPIQEKPDPLPPARVLN